MVTEPSHGESAVGGWIAVNSCAFEAVTSRFRVACNEHSEGPDRRRMVLHVCSDLAQQRIYTHLVSSLDLQGVPQVVYAAVRTAREAGWRAPELAGVSCHVRHVLSRRHRLLFRAKVRRVARDLESQVDLGGVRIVHAHFLYSDGAVALRLKESRGLPYVVAVRNTDLNAFMRYRPDLNGVRDRVLAGASRIVFLSEAYRRILERRLGRSLCDLVARKSVVIPNGVPPAWLESPPGRADDPPAMLRLLYVGDFSRNKNLPQVLEAAARLAGSRRVTLTLVGGGGDGEAELRELVASGRYPFASMQPRVEDAAILRDVYRRHDVFVMPSRLETFGVVYVEALSQGLPIVHSRGQGVDGYFATGTVAEAVDPDDADDIAARIDALAGRLPGVRATCIREAARFDWRRIARAYADLYDAVSAEAGVQ